MRKFANIISKDLTKTINVYVCVNKTAVCVNTHTKVYQSIFNIYTQKKDTWRKLSGISKKKLSHVRVRLSLKGLYVYTKWIFDLKCLCCFYFVWTRTFFLDDNFHLPLQHTAGFAAIYRERVHRIAAIYNLHYTHATIKKKIKEWKRVAQCYAKRWWRLHSTGRESFPPHDFGLKKKIFWQ